MSDDALPRAIARKTVSKISPEYPRVSLPKASEKMLTADKLIEHNPKKPFFKEEEVARALGYKGLSGASVALLAALKKFGLLEDAPGQEGLKLSSLARQITARRGEYSDESFEALEQAAFFSEVFSELRGVFGKEFPPLAAAIKFLLQNRFMPKAVPRLLTNYYETLKFLSHYSNQYPVPIYLDQAEIEHGLSQIQFTLQVADDESDKQFFEPPNREEKKFYFQIPDQFEATVLIKGLITPEVIDSLIGFLEISKKSFSKD